MLMSCCVLAASAKSSNPRKSKSIPVDKASVFSVKDVYCTVGSQTVTTGDLTVTRRCVACTTTSMADAISVVDKCLNGRQAVN